ncbi:MAG: hypothetical protein NUV51_10935 [Sulfuricaulis sp.]|nr:hypothetical protein [Sulfuricaulis sp.]
MTRPHVSTDEELQADMEACRLDHEEWLANRRHGLRPAAGAAVSSQYDPNRTEEDDRLDDPRHGQADGINRGQ